MDAVTPIFEFNPEAIRIAVKVEIEGPMHFGEFSFSLDTGATRSSIRPHCLQKIGYDLSLPVSRINVRSVTGVGVANTFRVRTLSALGQKANDLLLIAQEYPKSVTVDGLPGLDFFRGRVLNLDFFRGRITLRPPHPRWQFWR